MYLSKYFHSEYTNIFLKSTISSLSGLLKMLWFPIYMRALKKSDSLLKELGFFYEKWYNGNERRGIEHAER